MLNHVTVRKVKVTGITEHIVPLYAALLWKKVYTDVNTT